VGYLVKLLMSAALVAFIVFNFNVAAAVERLTDARPAYALAALGLFLIFHALSAVKLRVALPQRSAAGLFAYILAAQAYALLLPGQVAGEAMKAYRLARGTGAAAGGVVSAVAFDKLTAMASLLTLAMAGLAMEARRDGEALLFAVIIAGLTVMTAAAALLASRGAQRLAARVSAPYIDHAGRRGRLARSAQGFFVTWRSYAAQPRVAAASLGWGMAAQCVQALATLTLGQGLGVDLAFGQWCVVIGVLALVLLAPVAVGGLGLREASLVGLLGVFGVDPERALALALAVLAIQIVIAVIGLAVDVLALRDR
jgi:glycosyltransferase 2 family protein